MTAGDLDVLQAWVGRSQERHQSLDPFPARALHALMDHEGDLAPDEPLALPAHWLYFLDTPRRSMVGEDGHPQRGDFLPPVPLPRRMWAAGQVDAVSPLRLGQAATRRSTVRSVEAKAGRTGPLVFVQVDHELIQGDQVCVREAQHLVYREAPAAPRPLPPGTPPAAADWSTELTPDAALLFRFSALTYNGHRIHYDQPYTTGQEHYPGLVVHGPLLVTLLIDAWRRRAPATTFAGFRFRALRPSFVDRPLTLAGRRSGSEVALWTVDADGAVGMQVDLVLP